MGLSTPALEPPPVAAVARALEGLRPALAAAPVAMAVVGLDGTYLEVNALLGALLGRSQAELRGARTSDFTHADDVAASDQGLALTSGAVSSLAKRYVRPDGTVVHALRFSRLVSDVDGRPLFHYLNVVDVTERWAAERGLAALGRAALDGATGTALRTAAEHLVARALHIGPDESAHVLDEFLAGNSRGEDLGDAASLVLGAANVLAAAEQRRQALESVRHQALHDPLTGLPNRLLLGDRIRGVVGAARRHGAALLLLDLDGFKAVNDTYGHAQGDALLREVAARVRRAVRPEDTVVRLGGDEFAVLLEGVDRPEAAEEVAQRIIDAINEPISRGRIDMRVGTSVGIVYTRDPRTSMEKLLGDADFAMYAAKSSGRNRSVLYSTELRSAAARRGSLEAALARAIGAGELLVEYQPVVRLDGSWIGMEALVRWQHPDLGLLGPGEFIPLAEESGLIEPLGLWVLENALAATARWKDQWAEASDFCICVNISARQLVPGFAERVVDAIRRHGVPPEAVVLEMTESVLMERAASEYAVLAQLREYGVRIAIDDFGTGYSSLSYLVRLPVDIVKLDRSFTSGLVASSREASVVRALTGLVRDLELDLIAEGVEHADQVEALRGLGCHLAQGWYYDRSLPEAEVHRRLGAR